MYDELDISHLLTTSRPHDHDVLRHVADPRLAAMLEVDPVAIVVILGREAVKVTNEFLL